MIKKAYRIEGKDINNSELFPIVDFVQGGNLLEFLQNQKGDTIVLIEYHYDIEDENADGFEYAKVIVSNPIGWDGLFITNLLHYERRSKTKKWNSVDESSIDKIQFPNGNQTIVDSRLFLDLNTGLIHDSILNKESCYNRGDEILRVEREEREDLEAFPLGYEDVKYSSDPKEYEWNLKDGFIEYYKYLRYVAEGRAIEKLIVNDLIQRSFESV